MFGKDHLAFEEWADSNTSAGIMPRFGPYSEKEPRWCIICGAPLVTCKGEDHDGTDSADSTQASLQHYLQVFGEADREAAERLRGIQERVQRDLDPEDDFIPFE